MWVVSCKQTGEEIDRVELRTEASTVRLDYEQSNTFGYTTSLRWED